MSRLHALGMRTSVITGDNEQAARHFARAAGIEDVHAHVLPAEKAVMVRKLQETARVAMVGDGINDAPALMQADVGIAFGSGADIAIESADVIILNQRLGAVLDAYEVSRYSYGTSFRTSPSPSCSTVSEFPLPPRAWFTQFGGWSPWRRA